MELTAAGEALTRAALSAVERGAATVRAAASCARRRAECLA